MEQYWMPKKLDLKNLRLCIDNYKPDSIFIRLVGSMGGTHKVDMSLVRKKLDFVKDKAGLHMIVSGKEVFYFPLKDYVKGFSLAYERFWPDGRWCIDSHGKDPDNPILPKPKRSFLRTVLDDHLMEIYFKGKIALKFHSWFDSSHTWKLYTIAE